MSDSLERKRRKDLESSIQETLDLIKQYEEKRRLADDPKEQKDCERQIADLRQLLEEYRAELSELEEADGPQIELWPSNIPAERYYPLPGREQALSQLLKALQDPQGPPAVVVDGLGGIGKTAMAVELARRALRQGAFEGAVGDSAKQEMLTGGEIIQVNEATLDFDGLLNAIARQLERWEMPTMKTDEKRAAISRLLRQHRYLVLVDNLETAENANKLVAHLQGLLNGSRAIVTSRKKVRHGFVRALSLRGLEVEDSVFFLRRDAEQREVEQIIEAPREDLVEIHEVTGGAPLALKLVVGQAKFLDLEPVLSGLQQAGSELYPFIFRQSWEQLSPAAQRALIYIGWTVVTSVGWEELANVGIAQNEMALKQAVDELIDYSLLDVSFTAGEPRYSVHQLTRRFVNSDLPELWEEQGLM
jgi:LuxR family glucitol operon transcriptional activator